MFRITTEHGRYDKSGTVEIIQFSDSHKMLTKHDYTIVNAKIHISGCKSGYIFIEEKQRITKRIITDFMQNSGNKNAEQYFKQVS